MARKTLPLGKDRSQLAGEYAAEGELSAGDDALEKRHRQHQHQMDKQYGGGKGARDELYMR